MVKDSGTKSIPRRCLKRLSEKLNLLAITFSVLAIGISFLGLYLDAVHHRESIEVAESAIKSQEPHMLNEEVKNNLEVLDTRIARARGLVDSLSGERGIADMESKVSSAENLRNEAELAFNQGRYSNANVLIEEASANINEVLQSALGVQISPGVISVYVSGGVTTRERSGATAQWGEGRVAITLRRVYRYRCGGST